MRKCIIQATLAILASTVCAQAAIGAPAPAAEKSAGGPAALDDYKLSSGDRIRIIVYGEDGITGEYSVTDEGVIDFPLAGKVPASGHPLKDITTTIEQRLARGYIKDPRVNAEIVDYRPFYIFGEVQKPGKYPFAIDLTLQQAIAAAGGFTYRANLKKVFLRHQGETTESIVNAKAGPVALMPGDTIRISERFF